MAKLLGHEIVTTAELQQFEEEVVGEISKDLHARIVATEAKIASHKKFFVAGGIAMIVLFGLMVFLLVR